MVKPFCIFPQPLHTLSFGLFSIFFFTYFLVWQHSCNHVVRYAAEACSERSEAATSERPSDFSASAFTAFQPLLEYCTVLSAFGPPELVTNFCLQHLWSILIILSSQYLLSWHSSWHVLSRTFYFCPSIHRKIRSRFSMLRVSRQRYPSFSLY
jgi:hypothetical protein